MKRNGTLPEAIQNAPELQVGLDLHYQAFVALSSCRTHGFGTLSSIPWTAINNYAERYGIQGEQFDRLCVYVGAMDDHFLNAVKSKSE